MRLANVLNVAAGKNPGDGPDCFGCDEDVLHRVHADSDMDSRAKDVMYEISFRTAHRPGYRALKFPLPHVDNPRSVPRPQLRAITAAEDANHHVNPFGRNRGNATHARAVRR